MKARVKLMLPGFTGNMDDVVIYYNAHLNKYIARKKVKPKFTPSNQSVKDMFGFARRITLSEGYINDCREYVKLFNRKNRKRGQALSTWPNVFLKLMRGFVREHPEVDLQTLVRDVIAANGYPILTVAAAVDAGYLEPVPGYAELVSIM